MSFNSENTALLAILAELQKMNSRISSLESVVSSKPSAASGKASAASGGKPSAASGKPSATSGKPKKEKSADAAPRAPTAWRLFADRVRQTLREAGFEGRALGVECVQFCASLKEENADLSSWSDPDILARRAAWSAPEVSKQKAAGKSWRKSPSASAAASVASDGDAAPGSAEEKPKKARKNPWEGLSPEEKAERIAKMKAGKAAKKAAEASADEEAPSSDGEAAAASVTSSEKKKRGPKKHSEMTPEELAADKEKRKAKKEAKSAAAAGGGGAASGAPSAAALAAAKVPLPASAASSVSGGESDDFKPVLLGGVRYLINMKSGHSYHREEDGSQGAWAGIFSRTPRPHIDRSVPEPSDGDFFVEE